MRTLRGWLARAGGYPAGRDARAVGHQGMRERKSMRLGPAGFRARSMATIGTSAC